MLDQAPNIDKRTSASAVHNLLLAALSPSELAGLRPHLARVRLVCGQVLHESGQHIEHAYFIETGLVSMGANVDEPGNGIEPGMAEIGMVGPEGLVGLAALRHPGATSYGRSVVQIPGIALRIPMPALRVAARAVPALERVLLDVSQVVAVELAQTAACNSRHSLPKRLARWLLMAHDRAEGDELPLTQASLSIMLGVRRSGITVAANALEQSRLIQHSRGRISITDRAGLETASCACYARVRAFAAGVEQQAGDDRSVSKDELTLLLASR